MAAQRLEHGRSDKPGRFRSDDLCTAGALIGDILQELHCKNVHFQVLRSFFFSLT